jgi:murein L,D-transpeptidase YcbB/YkuD
VKLAARLFGLLGAVGAAAGQARAADTPLPLCSEDLCLERLGAVLALAEALPDHGIRPEGELEAAYRQAASLHTLLWAEPDPTGEPDTDRPRALLIAETEQALGTLWIGLARALGATRPHPGELPARQEARLLEAMATWAAPKALVTSLLPPVPGYAELVSAYARYRALVAFVAVPATVLAAKPGGQHPAIPALRARLAQEDPTVPQTASEVWDEALTAALVRTREGFTLPAQAAGRKLLDKALMGELGRPLAERLATIELNLSRYRESEVADYPYVVFVNLPEYHGVVLDGDQVLRRFRVVIGGRGAKNRTPTLSAYIHQVIYNPYWNVPERILEDELLVEASAKAAGGDPFDWLKGRGFEVMEADNPEKRWVRRRPGPGNALGKVKLVFENRYFVYMHDTPTKRAFEAMRRSMSHGCIRVHEPLALAELLLNRDGTWEEAVAKQVFEHYRETPIALRRQVPLVVGYLTVKVAEDGRVFWLEDVYGRDRQAAM